MVKKVVNNDLQEALGADLALVDFSATWCGPCQMLAPVVNELAEEMGDRLQFYSVDVDKNAKLSEEYNIMSVPTVILIKSGTKVAQAVGFRSKENLKEFIQAQI